MHLLPRQEVMVQPELPLQMMEQQVKAPLRQPCRGKIIYIYIYFDCNWLYRDPTQVPSQIGDTVIYIVLEGQSAF